MKKTLLIAGTLLVSVGLLASCGSASYDSNQDTVAVESGSGFTYATYAASSEKSAASSGEPYAIFWASESCGTCEGKDKQIKEEMASFPEGTTILRAEWDSASDEMKEKYGVVKYDTFTVFDGNGNFESIRGASIDDVRSALVK